MDLLPDYVIQALYGLSGVFFILSVTTFYYFRDKVDEYISQRTREFFSSPSTGKLIEQIKKGKAPMIVLRDFVSDLFRLSNPRRRLNALLLLLPTVGCLFLLSASISFVVTVKNGFELQVVTVSEYISYFFLIVAISLVVYSAFHLTKLTREL